jgi:protein O-GlcNAcase/histone acetyltransferase
MNAPGFRSGVVEGFYGRPWTGVQRRRLFRWMSDWSLNSYLYAPKDDPKHRAVWRQLYSDDEMRDLTALIRGARRHRIDFIYGIGPGLDLRFASSRDIAALERRIGQLRKGGCRTFALLFDDVPLALPEADRKCYGTPARAQALLANQMLRGLGRDAQLLFCPTVYCGRMAGGNVADSDYLRELGERLDPAIDVFWTGPEIISEKITVADIRQLRRVLRRKPVLWDNLHANDYDVRRIYVGPYSGRPEALRNELSGILSNPNCEFEANYVPIRTLAAYMKGTGRWQPRAAYRAALRQWIGQWQTRGKRRITLGDLELLGDCLYLPKEHGQGARRWLRDLQTVLNRPVSSWGAAGRRFVEHCARIESLYDVMTTMTNRDLLHTFYRFIWELKEESILWRRYVAWRISGPAKGSHFVSAEHRPGIYRGGLLAELQRLLPMNEGP